MPQIRSLFSPDRRIERPIESVITYGRDDESALRSEISEYYVTDHINRAMRGLLEEMQRAQQGGAQEVGVWVSGFYGSGKSSFSKYLGFALDGERKVGGEPFRKLLNERLKDDATKSLLNTVARNFNPYVLMVDLGSDQLAGRADQKISDILYHKVLQALGYPSDRKLAEFQMRLERDNKYTDFLARVQALKGRPWPEFMNASIEAMAVASRLAHEFYPTEFSTATALSAMRMDSQLTVEAQVAKMIELARRRSQRENILFILDEAGHFVSLREELVLDLKAFAEIIKNVGGGKVWVMATAQQTLMEDAQVLNTENLYRLRDRFPLGVHLEANDITEITYQRLLSKSQQGEADLKALWATHCPSLRLATSLEGAGTLQAELQEKDFVNLYPFLPSTFQMLVRLLGRLAKKTGGTGLRSAIKVVQELMNAPGAAGMATREVGAMVTAADLYDALVNDIRPGFSFLAQGVDDVGTLFPRSPLHLKVAKAIAVLQVLELVDATPSNLAAVLCPGVAAGDGLRREVDQVLRDFEQDGRLKIQPGQRGAYIFLSEQATGLHQVFESLTPEPGAVQALLNKAVLKALQEDLPQATVHRNKTIKVALEVMMLDRYVPIAGGNEAVKLRVRFVSSAQADSAYTEVQQASGRPTEVATVTTVALRQESHLLLATEVARCERFLARFTGQVGPEVRDYLHVVTQKKERAEQELVMQYTQAMRAAPIYAHGLKLSLDQTVERLSDAFARLLGQCGERIYADYPKAAFNASTGVAENFLRCEITNVTTVTDPLSLIRRRPAGVAELNRDHPALVAIVQHLRTHGVPLGKDLLRAFEAPPFGWSPDTIRYLIAALLQGGLVELKIGGNSHRTASTEAIQALSSTSGFRDVSVKLREDTPDLETFGRVVERLADLIGTTTLPIEASIAKETRTHVPQLLQVYGGLAARLQASGCAAHPRVTSLVDKLRDIVSADGTDIIAELGPVRSALYDEWTWVRNVVRGFTTEVQAFLENARLAAGLTWTPGETAFESLRAQSKIFSDIAELHRRDERADGAFAGLHIEAAKLPEFWSSLCRTASEVFESRLSAARRRLEAHPDWIQVDDEFRARLIGNLTPTRPAERLADAELSREWLACVSAIDNKLTYTRDQLEAEAARLRHERERRIEDENQKGQRPEEEFILRIPRTLDSVAKIDLLRRQISDCESRMGQTNLRIKTEFID